VSERPRHRLETLLEEELESFVDLLRHAANATKRVRQQTKCPSCRHTFRAEYTVKDVDSGLKALQLVLDRLEGRAGIAQPEQDASFTFVNRIVLQAEDGPPT
jgi:hypothetical protein